MLTTTLSAADRPLVGVNYFAGWWRAEPNKWRTQGKDWRELFPGRVPLLGEYNEQETMDREIAAAADFGVDFFAILWYAANPEVKRGPHTDLLNVGLETFIKSPQAGRMKFYIEFCNQPPYGVTDPKEWQKCIRTWVGAMHHPSYLRVGGRPVFKIFNSGPFVKQYGGDMELVKERLEQLRQAARDDGVGELLIGEGVAPSIPVVNATAKRLFDFTGCYNASPPLPHQDEDYSYDALAEYTANSRAKHKEDVIPYVPYVEAGWNPRPWVQPGSRYLSVPWFALPDRSQWRAALLQVKEDLKSGKFGFPLPGGGVQPAFTIYAWNEFGEGGIVAPTKGEKYMKLEVIKEVFGPAPAPIHR